MWIRGLWKYKTRAAVYPKTMKRINGNTPRMCINLAILIHLVYYHKWISFTLKTGTFSKSVGHFLAFIIELTIKRKEEG